MKKILLVAISATLLVVGCQKTEVIGHEAGHAMSFTTGMSKLTKAVGSIDAENDGIRNLEAQDFSVWAYADDTGFENSTLVDANGIYDEMQNLHINCTTRSEYAVLDDPATTGINEAKDAVPGVWSTGKEYYWPGKDKNLKFFAVSADGDWLRPTDPNQCPVVIDADELIMNINGFKVRNVPVVDNSDPTKNKPAADEDLMVAEYVIQDQEKKNVDLVFHHTLAKVQFQFKTINVDDVAVYVQSLVVEDLETTGDLEVTFTPESTDKKISFDWGELPEEGSTTLDDFTDDWETEVITSGTDADAEFPELIEGVAPTSDDKKAMKLIAEGEDDAQIFTTWLVLPQSIDGKKVKITYLMNKRRYTSTFALDEGITGKKWGSNQYIRYTVTIAPSVMTFVPEVDIWDNVSVPEMQN